MELFSDIFSLTFSEDRHGRTLFHPWGLYGKGYVVQESARMERMQAFIRRYFSLTFIGLCIIVVLLGWRFGLIFGGLMIVWYFLRVKFLVRGCTPVNVPFRERLREVALLYKYAILWFLFLFSIFGILFSVYIAYVENLLLGLLGAGTFGFTTFTYGMMLYLRGRTREKLEYD
ncbi:MAG TPA: hypothetical protein VKA68_17085 [bacterium]|nr:hypothetical protein [bacterium]